MKTISGMRVVVTGARGMLAGDLLPLLRERGVSIEAADLRGGDGTFPVSSLDITQPKAVREYIEEIRPDWIINCAAYTAVDEAERSRNIAFEVNASGPANLARAAKEIGARLLHLSTDYVFGSGLRFGERTLPFREDEIPAPCGIYGQSKRFGDELVTSVLPESHLIVRTSWLHGLHGPNFVKTIVERAKEKPELAVVNDQRGSPTWSKWLGETLMRLIEQEARGIFHVTSRGDITWFDFAVEILRQANITSCRVTPQSTEKLARPAPRPAFSTLDVSKVEKFLGTPCISWQGGITGHLQQMGIIC